MRLTPSGSDTKLELQGAKLSSSNVSLTCFKCTLAVFKSGGKIWFCKQFYSLS